MRGPATGRLRERDRRCPVVEGRLLSGELRRIRQANGTVREPEGRGGSRGIAGRRSAEGHKRHGRIAGAAGARRAEREGGDTAVDRRGGRCAAAVSDDAHQHIRRVARAPVVQRDGAFDAARDHGRGRGSTACVVTDRIGERDGWRGRVARPLICEQIGRHTARQRGGCGRAIAGAARIGDLHARRHAVVTAPAREIDRLDGTGRVDRDRRHLGARTGRDDHLRRNQIARSGVGHADGRDAADHRLGRGA